MKRILSLTALVALICTTSPATALPWNEEATDSLGPCQTIHSTGEFHSTFHYDLVKVLLLKSGIPEDTAEIIARYSTLVDQINAKPNYPYPEALNNISIPDTFPDWPQSLAGTERGNPAQNITFNETPAIYWHFALRDPADTISGPMVYGPYPEPMDPQYRHYPYFWRVPFTEYLTNIRDWAIYGTGEPGKPDLSTPVTVQHYNPDSQAYEPVPPGSLAAFGIFLHVLADAYSHEDCAVGDTLRSHPPQNPYCGLTFHSGFEYAYDFPIYAMPHAEAATQATWRAIREYIRIRGWNYSPVWTTDDNGFMDGDGIPDELEDNGDTLNIDNFMKSWKSPSTTDWNCDQRINHSDHTTQRILACNEAILSSDDPESSRANRQTRIRCFPNPVKDILTLELPGTGMDQPVQIALYSMHGELVLSNTLPGGKKHDLSLSALPGGVYYFRVMAHGKTESVKVVKL